MLLYWRDEPRVSVCEPVLMKYFPAVFCLIHDFPHALLPALTVLVPASGHKLWRCWPLWLILRSGRVDGSQQQGGDGRASPQHPWWGTGLLAQPACQGLLHIPSRLAEMFTDLCETVAGSSCLEPCLYEGFCFFYQWQSCIWIFLA